jgi:plasmid stabilization system protein ParE
MLVELSDYVEEDLEQIGDYIALDNPERALTFLAELRREVAQLGRIATSCRLRPELGKDRRVSVFGRYVIVFRVFDDVVFVERVVHGARDLTELLR